jgi:hypothetical protein
MLKNKIILLFLLLPFFVFAQNDEPELKLDLPLFDLPYQIDAMNTVGYGFFSSYANPGMAQSLALTEDIYSSFHFAMKTLFDKWNWNTASGWFNPRDVILDTGLMLTDIFLLTYVPGGEGWLHEEFHRAVMTRHGVNSFNGMNTFPIGQSAISVNSVTDEDLIRFKAESPADFVRMHAAGIEGEYALIDRFQRNNFFYNQKLHFRLFYLVHTINSHAYIYTSGDPGETATLDAMNRRETSIVSRDFTGFDMAGWVYDLFRPDEPYAARGTHPSGTGIDRYIKTGDLTDAELNYLHTQRYWHIFNYVSPMILGIDRIPLGDTGFYGNFTFRHLLASFGADVSLKVFLKKDIFNMAFAFHNHFNYEHWFPAVEAELVDFPVSPGVLRLYLSPRLIVGTQPENQKFKTGAPEFLGLAGCRVDFNISKHFLPYFDFTAKTDGWITGNEFIEKNISIKLGISARF